MCYSEASGLLQPDTEQRLVRASWRKWLYWVSVQFGLILSHLYLLGSRRWNRHGPHMQP